MTVIKIKLAMILICLGKQEIWLCDGNFNLAVSKNAQTFVIAAGTSDGLVYPASFVLLSGKNEKAYEKLHKKLFEIVGNGNF